MLANCAFYDLEPTLSSELQFLASLLRSEFTEARKENESPELWMYRLVMGNITLRNSVPNIVILLSIFLSLMMTNCSGERSFSVLKRVKNYLRSTMAQQRLTDLSLLCIEHELLDALDIDEIISDFATLKARKRDF